MHEGWKLKSTAETSVVAAAELAVQVAAAGVPFGPYPPYPPIPLPELHPTVIPTKTAVPTSKCLSIGFLLPLLLSIRRSPTGHGTGSCSSATIRANNSHARSPRGLPSSVTDVG